MCSITVYSTYEEVTADPLAGNLISSMMFVEATTTIKDKIKITSRITMVDGCSSSFRCWFVVCLCCAVVGLLWLLLHKGRDYSRFLQALPEL